MVNAAKRWAQTIKGDVVALYLASQDLRTPWYAKVVALAVVTYALSPIDLIPDFIPVLGYVDDLVIVPLGILLAVRLIPPALMAEYRNAPIEQARVPAPWGGVAIIVAVWIVGAAGVAWWAVQQFG